MAIMHSSDARSEHQGTWLATFSGYLEHGWRLCYLDGSGAECQAASAAHLMSRRDGPLPTKTAYLTQFATSGDALLQGVNLALQTAADMDQVLLLTDSQSCVSALLKVASGTQPPCSGIALEF